MNEALFLLLPSTYLLSLSTTHLCSMPEILSAIPALCFGSLFIKSGIVSNHLDLALLQKQTEATWGPRFQAHLHSICAKCQRMSELAAASQTQHGTALINQCSIFLPLNMPAFVSLTL